MSNGERRDLLIHAKKKLGKVNAALEIGVHYGEHASMMDNILEPEKLYLLDMWGDGYYGKYATAEYWQKHKAMVVKKFEGRSNVEVVQGDSHIEHANFDDESLDFIYIDADHSYEGISKDIQYWYPKLRKGGIFAGHDYVDPELKAEIGVVRSVNEFRENHADDFEEFIVFGKGLKACWLLTTKNTSS